MVKGDGKGLEPLRYYYHTDFKSDASSTTSQFLTGGYADSNCTRYGGCGLPYHLAEPYVFNIALIF